MQMVLLMTACNVGLEGLTHRRSPCVNALKKFCDAKRNITKE